MDGRAAPLDTCAMESTNPRRDHRAARSVLASAAVVILVALGAAACGGDPAPSKAPAATVHLGEYYYRPAELTVALKSKVTLVNDGTLVHTWIVKGAGVGTAAIAPGQTVVLDLADVPPGTYMVYCDQPGHTQMGQMGTLTVMK